MHLSPTLAFFIQGIPESFVLILGGLILYNVSFRYSVVFEIALIQTIVSFLVRKLPFTPTSHTLILMLFLAISVHFCFKISMLRCLMISFSTLLVLSLVEAVMFEIWMGYYHLEYLAITNQPFNRVLFGLQPPVIMLFLVITLSWLKNFFKSHLSGGVKS